MTDKNEKTPRGPLAPSLAHSLMDVVAYQEGSVVSRTIKKSPQGTLTLFAFAKGEGLSEHSTPFDAFVQVLDGEAQLTIGGKEVRARAGEIVVMPAEIPHALHAKTPFKMLLTMIRG